MQLHLIDLSTPLHEQAELMDQACSTTGFFHIPISSIDLSVAEQAWDAATEFFALSIEKKQQVAFPEPGYPYGYSPFGYESLASSLPQNGPIGPDLKESLSVGPDCGETDVSRPDESWIRSPSLWPTTPAGLRPAWEAYYRSLSVVAEQLMAAMAVALDLPPTYFDRLIDRPITSMRALNYPALPPTADHSLRAGAHDHSLRAGAHDHSLRAGAHSDYGTLTILRTDDVPGLQIRNADGSWAAVDPHPDTFVVNLGDSIAQWTNDRWKSTVHRVVVGDGAPRQSFAFFHMANWDAVIECLPGCLPNGEQPRHEPAQAGPWLMRKFQSTVS